jgi:hypothetical protein
MISHSPFLSLAQDEGKEPISIKLYRKLCNWFLCIRETNDGVFTHALLVVTWNLACRVNNTVNIQFQDMCWSHHFDCFQVHFAHSKTDPTGDDWCYPRHIFSNPFDPLVCPVLSLAMYFTSCFAGINITSEDFLFPGPKQEQRFAKLFHRILIENETEVQSLGYSINQLGTHSIRKGASSYMTSLPGKYFFIYLYLFISNFFSFFFQVDLQPLPFV